MARARKAILVDARINGLAGAYGIARSVMKLTAHLGQADDGLDLKVLVNPAEPQLYPLTELAAHAELIETDITAFAVHRCRELATLIAAADAAVLYVPYPTFTPVLRPCPIVVTIHDCTIESDVSFAGSWPRQAALRVVTREVLRRAAAVTAPSRASLAEIRQHYPSAPHPTLVPNGVDISQFATVAAETVAFARDRYRLPDQFVLTVGAHRPHKNHELLVRVMTELPEHVSLVIAGYFDPGFPDRLPALISALGLESRVLLIPEVTEELLPAVYRAASVFAFPSLAEGFGMPVVEAMAAGTPVLASDIPALAEVTGAGALLLPPSDVAAWAAALNAVLTDAGLAARLSAAGAAVAVTCSWDRAAAGLRALLRAVATGSDLATGHCPLPPGTGRPGPARPVQRQITSAR